MGYCFNIYTLYNTLQVLVPVRRSLNTDKYKLNNKMNTDVKIILIICNIPQPLKALIVFFLLLLFFFFFYFFFFIVFIKELVVI